MNFLISNAHAEAAAPAPQAPNPIVSFLPIVFILGIFYFLVFRPQQKRQKQQEKFLGELKKGDRIVTSHGIIGTIKLLGDKIVTLEIDDGVSLKILRNQILESASNLNNTESAKA